MTVNNIASSWQRVLGQDSGNCNPIRITSKGSTMHFASKGIIRYWPQEHLVSEQYYS